MKSGGSITQQSSTVKHKKKRTQQERSKKRRSMRITRIKFHFYIQLYGKEKRDALLFACWIWIFALSCFYLCLFFLSLSFSRCVCVSFLLCVLVVASSQCYPYVGNAPNAIFVVAFFQLCFPSLLLYHLCVCVRVLRSHHYYQTLSQK